MGMDRSGPGRGADEGEAARDLLEKERHVLRIHGGSRGDQIRSVDDFQRTASERFRSPPSSLIRTGNPSSNRLSIRQPLCAATPFTTSVILRSSISPSSGESQRTDPKQSGRPGHDTASFAGLELADMNQGIAHRIDAAADHVLDLSRDHGTGQQGVPRLMRHRRMARRTDDVDEQPARRGHHGPTPQRNLARTDSW